MAKCLDALGEDLFIDAKGVKHDCRADIPADQTHLHRTDRRTGNDDNRHTDRDPKLDRKSAELDRLAGRAARVFRGLAVVGLPVVVDDQVFNAAAVLHRGRVLGIVPKSYLPNYKEFYDARYFAPAATARSATVTLASGEEVP